MPSGVFPVPMPVAGWDAISAVPSIPQNRAVQLVNMIPDQGGIQVRNGYEEHATALDDAMVETLMSWNGPASSKMFAAVDESVYEVTSAGDVGSAEFGSLTNVQFQHTNFATSGGNFLFIVNGADAPRHYNGSSWATPTITVATPANFIDVVAHQRRLWFVEKDTTDAWYLPVESVAGAAVKFPLGPVFSKGGHLLTNATWTVDTGAGMDDRLVFISSRGQAAIYVGTDPSDATLWQLVGVYDIGTPIGRRCWTSFGGDVWIITTEGIISLQKILQVGRDQGQMANVAYTIGNAHTRAVELYGANFGWEITSFPEKHIMIVNIPTVEKAESVQHVMNTVTGAWCKFINLNTSTWHYHGSSVYFGGVDVVYKGLSGNDDNGGNIVWEWISPWSGYAHPAVQKQVHMARMTLEVESAYFPSIGIDFDFVSALPSLGGEAPAIGTSVWDTGVWDSAIWSGSDLSRSKWVGVSGVGFVASAHVLGATQDIQPKITALDILYERGAVF